MSMDVPQVTIPDPCGWPETAAIVSAALKEDVGAGDLTTAALVPGSAVSCAVILARNRSVVSGTGVAAEVFRHVNSELVCRSLIKDGAVVPPGGTVMTVRGPAGAILTAERTALNLLQRMCGIATLTRRFVDAVAPLPVAILDTRKTTPCLRRLEKYAVLCGGGRNHRMGLYDMVLIKDNHRRFWSAGTTFRLDRAVEEARRRCPGVAVEIEVETEDELSNALEARPDWVLLDNMPVGLMARCVSMCRGICRTEASGGITLETVAEVARTGVDAISIGALTHSAPAADLSLEVLDNEAAPR
jgi:nicotinate-nucleotide pyrophosphorylase (carboxylating)